MSWEEILRLAVLISMAYGAYDGFKRRPKPLRFQGRVYDLLPDGRFCTRWYRIVTDPQLVRALREFQHRTTGAPAVAPPAEAPTGERRSQ